jgi:hypothetical protein
MAALRDDLGMIEHLRIQTSESKDDTCDLINSPDRENATVRNINEVNKKLVGMFHTGKGKKTKGKGFAAMSNEAAEKDIAVVSTEHKLCIHDQTVNKTKSIHGPWTDWNPKKVPTCHEVFYNLKNTCQRTDHPRPCGTRG